MVEEVAGAPGGVAGAALADADTGMRAPQNGSSKQENSNIIVKGRQSVGSRTKRYRRLICLRCVGKTSC